MSIPSVPLLQGIQIRVPYLLGRDGRIERKKERKKEARV
jgi:hypothetical protein